MKKNNSIIIDTNILVYLLVKDSIFHNTVVNKLKDLLRNKCRIFITSQIRRELIVSLSKFNNKLHKPKPLTEIIQKINSILEYIPILFENQDSLIILDELILLYNISGYQIHDANIVSVAINNNIEYLLTNNIKDFKCFKEIEIIGLQNE